MGNIEIEGLILTPLKKIFHRQGDIYHAMKKSDEGFLGFSEAYFSNIHYGETKSWKKHLKMTLNLIVPIGEIKFVFFDDRTESKTKNRFFEISLSINNYYRITLPPNIWMAFKGIGKSTNLLLNIANLEHDPFEIERKELNDIPFKWSRND
jgi:dTDP-4-dehydrorhamnose 3,5-epimerase